MPRPEPVVKVTNIQPGNVPIGDDWAVRAARVHHVEPWLESLAYRVDTEEGSIVFAGDTGPCESLVALAQDADVLVVNCWDHQVTMVENGEAPGQTGTLDAAQMAQEASVKNLILAHTGPSLVQPGSREKAIADIARIYAGEIIFGEELMQVRLW